MAIFIQSLLFALCFSLLGLSFFISSKLKFINLMVGVSFASSSIILFKLLNHGVTLFLIFLAIIFFNILLSACCALLKRLSFNNQFISILVLCLGYVLVSLVHFPSNLTYVANNINKGISSFWILFFLIIINWFSFIISYFLSSEKEEYNSYFINLTFANILSSLSGMFYFLKLEAVSKDFIMPLIIAISVYLLSKVFLGSAKNIFTKLLLIFTSSVIISEVASFFNLATNLSKNYVYIAFSILCYLYLKYLSKAFCLDDYISKDSVLPFSISIKSKKDEAKDEEIDDFIESIKAQYV